MAYVLGFFAADGSTVRNSRGAHFIEFTVVDKTLLEQVRLAVASNHTISVRPKNSQKHRTQYRLQFGSKKWFYDLSALGFSQNKSLILRFPKMPKAMVPYFIRGYFDGDGCIYFKQHWSTARQKKIWVFTTLFTSGSRNFLKDLHEVLCRSGLNGGHISEKKRGYALVFSRQDSLALYRFMYDTVHVTELYLPRKYKKFTEAIKTLYGKSE